MGCGASNRSKNTDRFNDHLLTRNKQSNNNYNNNNKFANDRPPSLTREHLNLINREEEKKIYGALGLICNKNDFSDFGDDSSEYDSDASSITSVGSFMWKESNDNILNETIGLIANAASPSVIEPRSYVMSLENDFAERENDIEYALSELKKNHDKNLNQKRKNRKRNRERQLKENRKKIGGSNNIYHGNVSDGGNGGIGGNGCDGCDGGDGCDGDDGSGDRIHRQKDEIEEMLNGDLSPTEKIEYERRLHSESKSIVEEAIIERKSLEKKTLAEQGRQRVRTQHKRVKNFFKIHAERKK